MYPPLAIGVSHTLHGGERTYVGRRGSLPVLPCELVTLLYTRLSSFATYTGTHLYIAASLNSGGCAATRQEGIV